MEQLLADDAEGGDGKGKGAKKEDPKKAAAKKGGKGGCHSWGVKSNGVQGHPLRSGAGGEGCHPQLHASENEGPCLW